MSEQPAVIEVERPAPVRVEGGPLGACPECAGTSFLVVHDGTETNFLCETCSRCWYVSMGWVGRVDPVTCPGCPMRDCCESTMAADALAR
jgi:hypothetical protein